MAGLSFDTYTNQWQIYISTKESIEHESALRVAGFRPSGKEFIWIREQDGQIDWIDPLLRAVPQIGNYINITASVKKLELMEEQEDKEIDAEKLEDEAESLTENRELSEDVMDVLERAILETRGKKHYRR